MPASRLVAILIFDEVEVLDFCGPFEVFSVASHVHEARPFEVITVSMSGNAISARGGLSVNPHKCAADCPPPNVLLVPGGYGTRSLMDDEPTIAWIRQAAASAELVLSVCTGALLLAKAGLLDGLEATTHHMAIDLLRTVAPQTKVCPDKRHIDNGRVITSAGISAGIDMALYVVGRLLGEDTARRTAEHMEYNVQPA